MVQDISTIMSTYVCDADAVYNFTQTENSLRTNAMTVNVEGVIVRTVQTVEKQIGRKITPFAEEITIHNGRFCTIIGDVIFMNGVYFDINGITTLTEDGIALVQGTDFIINKPNQIERINGAWSTNKLGIVIVGVWGMGYSSTFDYTFGDLQLDAEYAPDKALRQIVIEEVAIKCGLVKYVVADGDGAGYQNNRTNLSKMTMDALQQYIQPVVG